LLRQNVHQLEEEPMPDNESQSPIEHRSLTANAITAAEALAGPATAIGLYWWDHRPAKESPTPQQVVLPPGVNKDD
jgi:hypothetical protein